MLKFRTTSRTPPDSVYTEPTTGYQVKWETSIDDLFDRVATHKKAHRIQLTEGWKDEVIHQLCMTLKVDDWNAWCYDSDIPYTSHLMRYGQRMWAELHEWAKAYPEKPDEHQKQAALVWFSGWVARIASAMNCDCAANWRRLNLGAPDVSGRASLYQWTVNAHDSVRNHMGQPIMEGSFRHLD